MDADEFSEIQQLLGLSDTKMAKALGVTRQTIRNWRTGGTWPPFARNAMRWMIALRRLDPANDNLPPGVRVKL
jgi:DNA-binding transcriptional regulator YiaG